MKRSSTFVLILLLALLQCRKEAPKFMPPGDYIEWMQSEAKEFRRMKEVNDLQLTVNYLPADYLAYREFMRSDSVPYDSILKFYVCGLTFHVTLQADKEAARYKNLLQYGLDSPEEVRERIKYLSFNIENFFNVQHNGTQYFPVLSHYEGFDAVANKISFQIVFLLPEYNCGRSPKGLDDVLVTFEDPYWDTGKNNFEYVGNTFADLPRIAM